MISGWQSENGPASAEVQVHLSCPLQKGIEPLPGVDLVGRIGLMVKAGARRLFRRVRLFCLYYLFFYIVFCL